MKNIKRKPFPANRTLIFWVLSSLCTLGTGIPVLAQQPKGWEDGEIEDVEIEIVQEREISLPRANRNFEKIPPRPSEPIKPPIQYDFQSFSFYAPFVNPQIRPLKVKAQEAARVHRGFVRAGYGNYASPLLEGYITSGKDKDKFVGAHLYHSSSGKGPVDGKNSGSGKTTASVFGKAFSNNITLSGSIDVENRTTHFYGYPEGTEVDRGDIRQSYNHFKLAGDLSNTRNADFSYKLGGIFSYLADKSEARETEVDLDFESAYEFNKTSKFTIDATYAIISRKDTAVDADPRSLFIVAPAYTFMPVEDLKLTIGLVAAYEDDTLNSKDLHLYPNVSASYPFSPSVDLVASLRGGMEKVSLQSLSYENIWIAPNVPVFHTNKLYELNVGVNAKLGNKVGAHAGLSFASIRNMHFFLNNETDASKFDVVYDEGVMQRTNLYASLSYAQSEYIKLMLRGDYFGYTTEDVDEAWHLPKYKLNANASFNVYQKLLFNIDIIGQGGMKALKQDMEAATSETVTLDNALDLNAKAEYLFSSSFSFFLQFNNITNNNYPIYLNYPARGFQVLGGITWSF